MKDVYKKPLDLSGKPKPDPIAAWLAVASAGVNIFQGLHEPVNKSISEVVSLVDELKRQHGGATPEQLEELSVKASNMENLHKTVGELQTQIAEQVPAPVAAPVVVPIAAVPASTAKTPWESKKFIALAGGVLSMILAPLLANIGMDPEQAGHIVNGIIALAGIYIGAQGVTDAVAARKDNRLSE